jgi:hypothetical protein
MVRGKHSCTSCDSTIGPKSRPGLCETCHDDVIAEVQSEHLENESQDALDALIDEIRTRWLPNHSAGDYVQR